MCIRDRGYTVLRAYDGLEALDALHTHDVQPVSYTHLDVYKRQESTRAHSRAAA